MKQCLALALLTLAAAAPAFATEALGKFFFTPTERAQLDAARHQKDRPRQKQAEAPPAPPARQVLSYSGVIRRSDGKAVLWLNNRPVDEKDALSSLSLAGHVRSDGAMSVRVPQTGRTIDLKPGQSVELTSGAVGERARITPSADVSAQKDASQQAPVPRDATSERTDAPSPKTDQKPGEAAATPRLP